MAEYHLTRLCLLYTSFKINLVYVKRCYGVPGDTVRISNGFYLNPRTGGKLGDQSYQRILSVMPDSVLLGSGVKINIPQPDVTRGWTIRNFGPMYVPRKGDVVDIDVGDVYKRQVYRIIAVVPPPPVFLLALVILRYKTVNAMMPK